MFLDGIQHSDTLVRGFEINNVVAYLYLSGSIYIQTDFFNHLFCKFHHPVIVLIGYVYLHAGEFRIVCAVHSFVTEVLAYFIHTFETTYDKSFQVQFAGDAHIQRHVQCVVMGMPY